MCISTHSFGFDFEFSLEHILTDRLNFKRFSLQLELIIYIKRFLAQFNSYNINIKFNNKTYDKKAINFI